MELLKIILPSLIVAGVVFYLIDRYLKSETERRNLELRKQSNNTLLSTRLRAYERLVIFLERTVPDSLVVRIQQPAMSALQLQTALLQAVREEYEHNVSQQLYVSREAWTLVNNAKESLAKLINTCAAMLEQMEQERSALMYAQLIIQTYHASQQETPSQVALDFLRAEAGTL